MSNRLECLLRDLQNEEKYPARERYEITTKEVVRKRRLEPIDWVKGLSSCRITLHLEPDQMIFVDTIIGYGNRSAFYRYVTRAMMESDDHKQKILAAARFGEQFEEVEEGEG